MNCRTIYIIIASLLSAFGFAWSIMIRIMLYTRYEVQSDVRFVSQDVFPIPRLSVCYTYPDSVKDATVKEIWNTFPSEKDVLDTSRTVILSSTVDKTEVHKYLKDRYVCYSIRLVDRRIFGSEVLFSVPPVMASFVLKPGLNLNNDNHSIIYLHDGALPDHESAATFGAKNGVTRITYGFQETLLLPTPYVTNCESFDLDDEYISRTDCINKCIKQTVLESSDLLSYDYVADEPLDKKRTDNRNATILSRRRCSTMCKPDCHVRNYMPRVLTADEEEENRIDLLYPADHRLQQQFYPQMTFVDLLLDMMELAVFWILISPLPFVMIEKTILSILKSEEEVKENRNGVRPYMTPAATAVAPVTAGTLAVNNNLSKVKTFHTSLSMESRHVPPDREGT